MRLTLRHWRRLGAGLLSTLVIGLAQAAETLPLDAFAGLPRLSGLTMSPDGTQIAALLNQPKQTLLIVRALDAPAEERRVLLASDNTQFQFKWVRWVSKERLLVSVRFPSQRGFVGTVETRLLSVKVDGSGMLNLLQRERNKSGSMVSASNTVQLQDHVIDWLPEDGRHVLLQLPADAEWMLPAVFKVDVETGERRMVQAPERDVWRWLTDVQHRVRIGVHSRGGRMEVRERAPSGGAWRVLWSFEANSAEAVVPLGFGKDPQELWIRAGHEGRDALFTVRLDDPALPRTLRLAHPREDIAGALLRLPASGEVIGLRSAGIDGVGGGDAGELGRSELWDTTWRRQALAIDKALPERMNRLAGISMDGQRYLVYSSGNGKPGEYYAGNRATGDLVILAEDYPELDPAQLAGKHLARIQARDGLTMSAYLSLPRGHEPPRDGPLPLVLLPHGGPQSRDDLDFDSWTEFLASRGYAVLQVNFRGSDGYGHAFRMAGLQRWGLEMQDDLSDAVAWAVGQGVADAKRVCIVGASYGGYAALMGAVKTPELYRCAASFAGVTDLQDLIVHEGQYLGGRESAEREFGRWWGDRERLRATSPALQAARITVPVLLIHGTADRVVPVAQSRDMAKALKSAGKPVRYVEQDGGDHHLSRQAHRREFFVELERFLAENLPVNRPAKAAAAGAAGGAGGTGGAPAAAH